MDGGYACVYCHYYGSEFRGTFTGVAVHALGHPIGDPRDMAVNEEVLYG